MQVGEGRRLPDRMGAHVAILLLAVMLAFPAVMQAEEPPERAAATYLALRDGGSADDYAVMYQRSARVEVSGETMWAAKLVDRRNGKVSIVYRDAAGSLGGPELVRGREAAALARLGALERKAAPGLLKALASPAAAAKARGPAHEGTLPVAIWVSVDPHAAEAAVIARHPEVEWLAGRPVSGTIHAIRAARDDLWTARRDVFAAAAAGVASEVQRAGGSVAYVSSSAPVLFVDLPPAAAGPIADLEVVESMGLEGAWDTSMATAGPTVDANWTSGPGDTGAGIRVAVVEYHNVRASGDLAGKVAASWATTGSPAYTPSGSFDHPTWVAGAIASQSSTYRGVAPAAMIVSAGTGGYTPSLTYDRRVIAAADWAVSPSGGDADIVNTSLVQDTATGSEEARRFFDSIADQDGRLPISAAGNYVNFNNWEVGSPGTGYNVLTVGGVDDKGTASRADDRIWYVPGSNGGNWLDPASDPWNGHGDYNKPNLVAPAVSVRTANGLAASGTSVATPIVSGIAAQLLSNEPALLSWPEAARAVLMAGAVHRVKMPDGSYNADHEGVGMTSGLWTGRIANQGDGTWGGYRIGSLDPGAGTTQQIHVGAGDRLRVVLAWSSHATASGSTYTDHLAADLDLRVTAPDGSVVGSFTFDNANEFVEMPITTTGTASIEIVPTRMDGGAERYGLAWAKIGDRTPPSASPVQPLGLEPWAVGSATPQLKFSETVVNVGAATVRLRSGSGTTVPTSLSYSSSSQTLTLTPGARLSPGGYSVILGSGITDAAGNALVPTSSSFTVADTKPPSAVSFSTARSASFAAGTYTGYRFDASGRVTARKTYALGRASSAPVDARGTLAGVPGLWLHVSAGIWAGYWMRESAGVRIRGMQTDEALPSGSYMRVLAGTHTGYRFYSTGSVSATRSYTLSRNSSAGVSRRAVINGKWYLYVVNGIWAGYWIPESGSVYTPGAFDERDLGAITLIFGAGRYTGRLYDANGGVRQSRTYSLGRSSSAPAKAWAIVNGQPSFYVTAGVWAGYWVPEAAGVHYP